MKCLPHAKIPLAAGMVLHDCHAEGEFFSVLLCWVDAELL